MNARTRYTALDYPETDDPFSPGFVLPSKQRTWKGVADMRLFQGMLSYFKFTPCVHEINTRSHATALFLNWTRPVSAWSNGTPRVETGSVVWYPFSDSHDDFGRRDCCAPKSAFCPDYGVWPGEKPDPHLVMVRSLFCALFRKNCAWFMARDTGVGRYFLSHGTWDKIKFPWLTREEMELELELRNMLPMPLVTRRRETGLPDRQDPV